MKHSNKILLPMLALALVWLITPDARAAKIVPGQVPVLQPLQPPPFDTAPDVSHNIQHSVQNTPEVQVQPDQSSVLPVVAPNQISEAQDHSSNLLLWFGIVVPLVFLGGWLLWRYVQKLSQED